MCHYCKRIEDSELWNFCPMCGRKLKDHSCYEVCRAEEVTVYGKFRSLKEAEDYCDLHANMLIRKEDA